MLSGRVALITGGNTGIGAATARVLAREGAAVAITWIDREDIALSLVDELRAMDVEAMMLKADVTDFARTEEVVAEVARTLGEIDILVNNAGINRDRVIWKMAIEDWKAVIDTDLSGAFNAIRAVAATMRARQCGRIVSVSSINGLRGRFGQTNYAAAKAGLIGLSKSAARELGSAGVTVNVVAPGLIATDMIASMPEEALERSRSEIVLPRLGEPEDVAELIGFLASDRARHITGEVIRVDGGQCM